MNEKSKSKRPSEIVLYTFLFLIVLVFSLAFLFYAPQLYGHKESSLSSRVNKSYLIWTGREVHYDVANSDIMLPDDWSDKQIMEARAQIRIREQQEIIKLRKERRSIRYKRKRIWETLIGK